MEISKKNYFDVMKEVGYDNLTDTLKKGYEFINRITKGGTDWKEYNKFQKPIDLQFSALGIWMDKVFNKKGERSSHKQKSEAQIESKNDNRKDYATNKSSDLHKGKHNSKERNKGKQYTSAKSIEKSKVKGKGVELVSPEVVFIKRFALLDGREKTKDQILGFIRNLQKAMVQRVIRKTSKYAKIIMEIQKELIAKYKKPTKKPNENIVFNHDHKTLLKYLKIAGAEYLLPSVRFIKSYFNIRQSNLTKEKANSLFTRIMDAMEKKKIPNDDKYIKQIRTILKSLEDYLKSGDVKSTLFLSESQLNGLECVLKDCGCHSGEMKQAKSVEGIEVNDDGIMTVQEARSAKFRPLELTGEWLQLIGKMCLPTHFLVYGLGGSGKTSFVLLFTQYLAKMGYKILYIAREQYNTPTFTDLLNRLNIEVGDNFKIVKDLNVLNPADYDFVVLDSKDDMDIQLPHFKNLKSRYPDQSFIAISQGTKTGDFTGKGQWRNAVDVMVYAENGTIYTGQDKNRWGGAGQMKIL
jgi:hypothetical protein